MLAAKLKRVNSFHARDIPQKGQGIPATFSMIHELSYLNIPGKISAIKSVGVIQTDAVAAAMKPKRMNRSLSDSSCEIFSTGIIEVHWCFVFCQ